MRRLVIVLEYLIPESVGEPVRNLVAALHDRGVYAPVGEIQPPVVTRVAIAESADRILAEFEH